MRGRVFTYTSVPWGMRVISPDWPFPFDHMEKTIFNYCSQSRLKSSGPSSLAAPDRPWRAEGTAVQVLLQPAPRHLAFLLPGISPAQSGVNKEHRVTAHCSHHHRKTLQKPETSPAPTLLHEKLTFPSGRPYISYARSVGIDLPPSSNSILRNHWISFFVNFNKIKHQS